jgi:hypothetical protein
VRESKGLMGLPAPHIGYDGIVQAGMQRIQINDGVLQMNGKQFSVSEDGQVTDQQDKPVAMVKDGKLIPMQQQQAPQ